MKPKQYAYKLLYEYSRILDKKSTDVQVIQCAMFYIQESISFVNIEDPLVNYYLEVKNYLLKKHHSASCNHQELLLILFRFGFLFLMQLLQVHY